MGSNPRPYRDQTGNESIRFSRSTAKAKKRIKAREQTRKASKAEAEPDPF